MSRSDGTAHVISSPESTHLRRQSGSVHENHSGGHPGSKRWPLNYDDESASTDLAEIVVLRHRLVAQDLKEIFELDKDCIAVSLLLLATSDIATVPKLISFGRSTVLSFPGKLQYVSPPSTSGSASGHALLIGAVRTEHVDRLRRCLWSGLLRRATDDSVPR